MMDDAIVKPQEKILVTGAAGFIGTRVVDLLAQQGFSDIRCLSRQAGAPPYAGMAADRRDGRPARIEVFRGNLLSREDCLRLTDGVALIYHLAAGVGIKSFSEAYLNSVVTTRNLLDAALEHGCLRRIVNVSSFAVYTNRKKPKRGWLDETCPVEQEPGTRAEAYCYGKVKQDELVLEYGKKHGIPWVIMRPGTVFGPGKKAIPGRVGIDTFGPFLHLGGPNPIPFTYVENCAEAIVMAGLKPGIDGHVFNVVDDHLPTSRRFLRLYKKNVKRIRSLYLPHALSYLFCLAWEKSSQWSKGQLPPAFTRREWDAYWKKTRYSNQKLKQLVGWTPRIPMDEGLMRFFRSCAD